MAGCWCTARFLVSSFTSSPKCVWAGREKRRESRYCPSSPPNLQAKIALSPFKVEF